MPSGAQSRQREQTRFYFCSRLSVSSPTFCSALFQDEAEFGLSWSTSVFQYPSSFLPSVLNSKFKLVNADHTMCLKAKEHRKQRRQGDDEDNLIVDFNYICVVGGIVSGYVHLSGGAWGSQRF